MSTPSEDVTTKRRRIGDSASPNAVQRKASCSNLPGDICGHCDKECTPNGEAIQCDLCYVWVHAECEGVTNEQYEKLNSIASTLSNVAYYCQLNSCHTRVKQLIASFISQPVNKDTIRGMDKSLSDLTVQVGKCIEDLGLKIENLLLNQTGLQMEVDSIQSQPTSAGVAMRPSSTSASAASSAAHSIIDELADRDRRKKNIIIYNLPEATDHAADKVSFLALCKTVFNLDVLVT